MSFELPGFDKTYCVSLTACACLETEDKHLQKLLAKKRMMISRYGRKRDQYVRVLGGGHTGQHLHVDCVTKEYFPAKNLPEITHKKVDTTKFLDNFLGLSAEIDITAVYVLPYAKLPKQGFIRSVSAPTETSGNETSGLGMKLVSAKFAVTNSPVISWGWSIHKNKKKVRVHLEAEKEQRITKTYLQELLDWCDPMFCLLAMENVNDKT